MLPHIFFGRLGENFDPYVVSVYESLAIKKSSRQERSLVNLQQNRNSSKSENNSNDRDIKTEPQNAVKLLLLYLLLINHFDNTLNSEKVRVFLTPIKTSSNN